MSPGSFARSARAECEPPVNSIPCTACRRIRAIENCVSRLISAARSTTSDDVGSTWRQIESPQSPALHCSAPLAYCVTEFGRLFVARRGQR